MLPCPAMGLFRRAANRASPPFWRVPPFRAEPSVLYQHGIRCVGSADGRGMMQTGWATWKRAGMHQHQAFDLLSDGYQQWAAAGEADVHLELLFLSDLFEELKSGRSGGFA